MKWSCWDLGLLAIATLKLQSWKQKTKWFCWLIPDLVNKINQNMSGRKRKKLEKSALETARPRKKQRRCGRSYRLHVATLHRLLFRDAILTFVINTSESKMKGNFTPFLVRVVAMKFPNAARQNHHDHRMQQNRESVFFMPRRVSLGTLPALENLPEWLSGKSPTY